MSTINSSQRGKGSPTLVYYTKNDNGDYCCAISKQSTPSRNLIIKRYKTGSTMALWKHLEKFHHSIYRDLKLSGTQNPLTNFFPKKSKYLGMTQELTKERYTDLIINMTWHLCKIWWWKGENATIVSTNWESVTHYRYLDYYKSFVNYWDHDSLDWWPVETSWICSCCQRVAWISWRCIHGKSVTWSAGRLQFDG